MTPDQLAPSGSPRLRSHSDCARPVHPVAMAPNSADRSPRRRGVAELGELATCIRGRVEERSDRVPQAQSCQSTARTQTSAVRRRQLSVVADLIGPNRARNKWPCQGQLIIRPAQNIDKPVGIDANGKHSTIGIPCHAGKNWDLNCALEVPVMKCVSVLPTASQRTQLQDRKRIRVQVDPLCSTSPFTSGHGPRPANSEGWDADCRRR